MIAAESRAAARIVEPAIVSPFEDGLLRLVPLALAAAVYYPLTRVYFTSDDFLNLYHIVNRSLPEYLLRPHGAHMLIARNAVFYVFYQLFGPRPHLFFWAVLLTHLLNVWLLCAVIRQLSGRPHIAAFGAALWGICPVHTGTLGWYSVYGQVLVATIVLLILNQAAPAAASGRPLPRFSTVLWPVLLLIGSMCFGIGIGLALVSPLMMFLLLPRSRQRTRVCLALLLLAVVLPFVYRGVLLAYDWLFGPSGEGFAANILFQNVGLSLHRLTMVGLMLSYGLTSLVLGFFGAVGKFPPTAGVVVTVIFAAALGITYVRGREPLRRQLLAFVVMAVGCYAIIAAGRSQFFRLATLAAGAAQPRYHYVSSLPFAIMICLILAAWCRAWRVQVGTERMLLLAWLALALVSHHRVGWFIDPFPYSRRETNDVLKAIDAEVAAAPPASDVFIPNQVFRSIGMLYVNNPAAFPGWAAVYTIYFPSNVIDGKRVYFTADDPFVLIAAKKGRRTAGLIVPPPEGRSSPP